MLPPLFLNHWLILINSCSYGTNFYSYCKTSNAYKITNEEAKVEIETNPVTAEAKISKSSIQFKDAQTFLCL